MNNLKTTVNEAAYQSLLKVNPDVIAALKETMSQGETAKKIERRMRKQYGDNNLTVISAVCAAYHIEAHRELLIEVTK